MRRSQRRRKPLQARQPTVHTEPARPSQLKAAFFVRSLPVLLVCLTFLSFLPSLQNELVGWDDGATLLEKPNYRGLDGRRLRWMFSTFYLGHYQPLSWVSFALDYFIWGISADLEPRGSR